MKLNRKNKKGFTIVELVIVIAVIGILAAILIPTFTNLTKNAQETAAKQTVSDAFTAYFAEVAGDGECEFQLYEKPDQEYVKDTEITKLPMTNTNGQFHTAIKYGNDFYGYTQEKGWAVTGQVAPAGAALIVKASDVPANKYALKGTEYVAFTDEYASTFNSCVIYALPVEA